MLSGLGAGYRTGREVVEAALDVYKSGQGHVVERECGMGARVESGGEGSKCLRCRLESHITEEGVDRGDGEVVRRGVDRWGLSRLHRGSGGAGGGDGHRTGRCALETNGIGRTGGGNKHAARGEYGSRSDD